MTNARVRMHERECRWLRCAHNEYRLEGFIDEKCAVLDAILNEAEEDRVHAETHRILDISMETMLLHGAQVNQGLGLAIRTIDPYRLVEGKLLRKSDGKPVHCAQCPEKKPATTKE